jgi:hypothetical protein
LLFVTPMKSGMVISGMRGMASLQTWMLRLKRKHLLAALGALFAVFADCSFSAEQALK